MASDRDIAEQILGKTVNDYISGKLHTGTSWSEIGGDLYLDTGGQADVSVATLKGWHSKPRVPLAI